MPVEPTAAYYDPDDPDNPDPPKAEKRRAATRVPIPTPSISTGEALQQTSDIELSATHGLRSGVQFQRVNAAGVGNPEVTARGIIDAVDVWGWVQQGVEVCFPGAGSILFLDAATSPRTLAPVITYSRADKSCAQLDRPGTLVQVLGPPPPPLSAGNVGVELENCQVSTTAVLNFRASPGGQIIGHISDGATIEAVGRTPNWFRVRYYGREGWISADYVRTAGSCS